MTALDIIVILLVGGGAFFGFRRGFVHEVLGLAAWIAGIVAVKAFHGPAADALAPAVGTPTGAAVLAFALVFGLTFLAIRLLAARVGGAARRSVVGPLDRLLGGGFGALKGLIGATLIFLAASLVTGTLYAEGAVGGGGEGGGRPEWLASSRTYPLLNASSRALVNLVEKRRARPERSDEERNR